MSTVVILNVVFAVFAVGGIVALLSRAILADNPWRLSASILRLPWSVIQPPSARAVSGARPA
jgi:hypothetical protein